jgi:hypothetical protein
MPVSFALSLFVLYLFLTQAAKLMMNKTNLPRSTQHLEQHMMTREGKKAN